MERKAFEDERLDLDLVCVLLEALWAEHVLKKKCPFDTVRVLPLQKQTALLML